MKAAYGKVFQVKDVPSSGVTRLVVELPIEAHVKSTELFYGKDVLVTLSPQAFGSYGIVDGEAGTVETETPKPSGNQVAKHLHVSGYFRNPKLWAAMAAAGIYTQAEHKAWLEAQPCFGIDRVPGIACEGDVVVHHVRTAANAGTGIKPEHWYGVPACCSHHGWAHASSGANRQDKDGLLALAVALTAGQMKAAMKRHLGIESLSDPRFNELVLKRFEREIGL